MPDPSQTYQTTQKFFSGTLWNHWAKMAQLGLGFIFTVIITRKLGESLYGKYSLFISICFFVGLSTQFGFENLINAYLPKLRRFPGRMAYLIRTLIQIRIGAGLIACAGFFAALEFFDHSGANYDLGAPAVYIVCYAAFTSLASLLSRVLVAQYRLKHLSLVNFAAALVQTSLAYIFLAKGYGLSTVLAIVTGCALLSCALCLILTRETICVPAQRFDLKPLFHFGRASWCTAVVEFGLGKQIDILLIGYFVASVVQVGYYNLAVSTVVLLSSLMTAGLSGVALTAFSEIEMQQGKDRLGMAWCSLIKLEYILCVPIIVFLMVYARPIIVNIYTQAYLPAAGLIQVYAGFLIGFRLFGGGVHLTGLYALGQAKAVLLTRCAGGSVNLALDLMLIPKYGAMGAVLATGACQMTTVILEYLLIRRVIAHAFPVRFIMKVNLGIAAALAILNFFPVNTTLDLLWAALAYGISVLYALYHLKPLDGEVQNIISKLNNSTLTKFASFYG